jgi:chromosome segregation ATPase
MNMPAISEQVATIEHDLQEALARIESLEAEKVALTKALTAMSVEKSDLEAKQNDMQSLVDETRLNVDRLANMTLDILRTSRRPVAQSEMNAGKSASGEKVEASEPSDETEAEARPKHELTGQNIGLKRVSDGSAVERLRAHPLMDTAAAPFVTRPRINLPERMPMFLQEKGIERHRGAAR